MKKNRKGYYHEVLDRLSIIQHNLEDFVINSKPIRKWESDSKKLLEDAQELLSKVYQKIGEKM